MKKSCGYMGIGPEEGTFVSSEDALRYALERLPYEDEQTKADFLDWFYSGNFLKVDSDGEAVLV